MVKPLLAIKDLKLHVATPLGDAAILRGIDLSVARGRILGIVGESGSGKSSLVSSIMGLLTPSIKVTGSIELDGVDLLQLSASELNQLRGTRMAMIFQDPMTALNPVFTVGTQLADVIKRRSPGTSSKEASRQAALALGKTGLADPQQRLRDYPDQLSGGMRQRVMIAMALLCQPDLLIADEPTTALDATVEVQIIDLLARLRDEFSGAIIFISHHLGAVSQLCDDVAVMYGGHLVETGKVREVLESPVHPYSRALIACEVDDQPPDVPLTFIPGTVPETTEAVQGCIFFSRCVHRAVICSTSLPPMRLLGNDRSAACFRLEVIGNE